MCQESDSSPLQLDPLEDYTSPISKLEPQKSMPVSVSVKWTVFKPTKSSLFLTFLLTLCNIL